MPDDCDKNKIHPGDSVVRVFNGEAKGITDYDIINSTVFKVVVAEGSGITLEGKDPEYKYTASYFRKVESKTMTQTDSSQVNNWIVISQFANGNLSVEMFPTEQLADASASSLLTRVVPPKKVFYAKVMGTYSVKTEVNKNSLEELSNLDILE